MLIDNDQWCDDLFSTASNTLDSSKDVDENLFGLNDWINPSDCRPKDIEVSATRENNTFTLASESHLLTDKGYMRIIDIYRMGKMCSIWTGETWSQITIEQQKSSHMVTICFSNGISIVCGARQKVVSIDDDSESDRIAVATISPGTIIYEPYYPTLKHTWRTRYPFLRGCFMGANTKTWRSLLSLVPKSASSIVCNHPEYRENNCSINAKNLSAQVPLMEILTGKISWLHGFILLTGVQQKHTVELHHPSKSIIFNIKLMLSLLDVNSSIKVDHSISIAKYILVISHEDMLKLWKLGLPIEDGVLDSNFLWCNEVTVVSVTPNNEQSETYCFTEPINNTCVVDGVLLG